MAATALAPVEETSERERHTVIIAAAVAAVLGSNARVRRIRETRAPAPARWVKQGRADIQGAHNLGVEIRQMPVGGRQ